VVRGNFAKEFVFTYLIGPMGWFVRILGVATVLTTAVAVAEQRAFDCSGKTLSPEAGVELTARVQGEYGRITSLRAKFHQDSFLAALEAGEQSTGSLWFRRPGLMKWVYEQPEAQTFVVRDHTVWLYQPEAKQVLIDEFRDLLISDLPIAFLMGIGNLRDDFTLVRACEGSEGTVLELTARQQQQDEDLRGFKLLIDRTRAAPIGARVVDVGGNVTAILFREVEWNVGMEDAAFATVFPPGTDINDQRRQG